MKRLFSLMMVCLLAFTGLANAQNLTVYDGTASNSYVPVYGFYADAYLKCEYVMPASELANMADRDIYGMIFYTRSQASALCGNANFQVFVKEVNFTTISGYTGTTDATIVYEGPLDGTQETMKVNFSTPYHYNGGNLLIGVYNTVKGRYKSCSFYGKNVMGSCVQGNNYTSLAQVPARQRDFLPKTTFVLEQPLPDIVVTPDPVAAPSSALSRPNGHWMRPFTVNVKNIGEPGVVRSIDVEDNPLGYFVLEDMEFPFDLGTDEDIDVSITTGDYGDEGLVVSRFVVAYDGQRLAKICDLVANAYDAVTPDVWELARTVTSFPYSDTPATRLLYDNYLLPGDNEDSVMADAVYKFTVNKDMLLNGNITDLNSGAFDGAILAIYRDGFEGEGGPGPNNAYYGPSVRSRDVVLSEGFETGQMPEGWTTIDADGDGYNWIPDFLYNYTPSQSHNGSHGMMSSQSFINYFGPLTPDNYLVTPELDLPSGGSLTYYVCAQDASYSAEHYAVYASTSGNGVNDFTINLFEETMTAGRGGDVRISGEASRNGEARVQGAWFERTVDIPAGTKYIAFRHFNCTDQFVLNLDDVTVTGEMAPPATASLVNVVLKPGTYYVVGAANQGFTVNLNAEELPCPEAVTYIYPLDNADSITSPVTLKWQLDPYATEYRLVFGSTYYCEDVLVDWTSDLANSYTVEGLYNNTNYFWRVDQRNAGACPEGVLGEVIGFTTTLNIPQNLRANSTQIYEGDDLILTWDPIVDRTFRQYNVYQNGQLIGHTTTNGGTGLTSYTVTGLDYNMQGYAFNVTAVYDEGESQFSNTVTVKVTGEGSVSGTVYEQDSVTGIEGATVTFEGQDEFGLPQTFSFTTNAQGAYSGAILAGTYMAKATCEGYQDATYYDNPVGIEYEEETEDIDFYMDEFFYPVGQVIAQYYPDSLDPESPYVKVYWSWDVMQGQNIIEDFETGDFSNYEWNNDATYPWTVVTTNPYEGTYCMKSGGTGIDNAVSSIDVTVEIPRDGLMSFFGKISSENNWDYGYFYIDGQQMGKYTGTSNWVEREFPITEGEHNFKWTYKKDFMLSANDDCFYVDYISFYHDPLPPTPAQPGWIYYDNGENVDAIGLTNGGSFYWGICFPDMSQYTGYTLTKASLYDCEAHTGKVMIYQGGATAPGTLVYQQDYTCTGSNQFVEIPFTAPVTIDPGQPLWIVMNNNDGQYVAAVCENTGDPNGRWVSIDGTTWEDIAAMGLDNTWMIRGYVDNGSGSRALTQTQPKESVDAVLRTPVLHNEGAELALAGQKAPHNVGVPAQAVAPAKGMNRSFQHFRIYRTDCYNTEYTPENTVLLASEVQDTMYIDVSWEDLAAGVYKWGVSCIYEGNRQFVPRESEIVWSNCLDKDMFIGGEEGHVEVTVLLNSNDNPAGTTVALDNLNEFESELGYNYDVTLDSTGHYAWEQFRRGSYAVNVSHEGYETVLDTVTIDGPEDLRYVLIEILYNADDLYVSRTGWAMWEGMGTPGGGGGGGGGTASTFSYGFDDGMENWTLIDADGDGHNWYHSSQAGDHCTVAVTSHGGSGHIMGESYCNCGYTVLHPDDYMVAPEKAGIVSGSTFSFWACAQDVSYSAEHFGVAVSTTGNTSASDFTTVQEWTLTAKGTGAVVEGKNGKSSREGQWYQFTCDLSAYAGQEVWIAIRHFGVSDQFLMCLDDVELSAGSKSGERHLEFYKVMCTSIDGEPIFNENTVNNFCQVSTESLVPGDTYICKVAAVYSTGMSEWKAVEWQYQSCADYAGVVNGEVTGEWQGENVVLNWAYPNDPTPPVPPVPGEGFTDGFESGMENWTLIDADGDGHNWYHSSQAGDHCTVAVTSHGGSGHVMGESYCNCGYTVLHPDDYMVIATKQSIGTGSTFSFWACAQDASYSAEHFGVAVSTTGNTSASDFTTVQEWTLTAKGTGAVVEGKNGKSSREGQWYQFTCDLSAYAGQQVWIAIRHFGVSDQFLMCLDDVELTAGSKGGRAMWDLVASFPLSSGGQQGIATDGNFIYTCCWNGNPGYDFGKYEMNGTFVEGFTISGATNIRDLTYDGTHFYGGSGSSTLYELDLANKTLVGTVNCSGKQIRHCSYDPSRDGFWVGNWTDLSLVDRTGATVQSAPAPNNAYGSGYYKDADNVEHLYLFCQPNSDAKVFDYNITTNTLGATPVFDFASLPGFAAGVSGGAFVGQYEGKTCFFGNVQQDPNLVGIYELGAGGGPVPPVPPVPGSNILGAVIYRDGEYLGFTEAATYTDMTPAAEDHEYCVRVVYDGPNELPDNNIYYSMSCGDCVTVEGTTSCEAGSPITGVYKWNAADDFGALISWGEQPAPPVGEWLYYDDGNSTNTIGAGGTIYWGIMIPSSSLTQYAGCSMTKAQVFDGASAGGSTPASGTVTLNVYQGGANAPETLVATQDFQVTGAEDWVEVSLTTPFALDVTKNLWITCYNSGIQFPASACDDTGDPNGRWVSVDGTEWMDIIPGSGGQISCTWMIRGFVTNASKGVEDVALDPFEGGKGGALEALTFDPIATDLSFMTRSLELDHYNVYRSADNSNYAKIGEVAAVSGQSYYEYFDKVEIGTYYYQVTAFYKDGDQTCESDPAQSATNPDNNYVVVTVTNVGEYDGATSLYPNPTSGNVTIEAAGMHRVTVVSALGQIVYDAEIDNDVTTLNMGQFTPGVYMVRIATDAGLSVKRVTVVK